MNARRAAVPAAGPAASRRQARRTRDASAPAGGTPTLLVCLIFLFALPLLAGDDCDITTRPAATLFLPYFDVDVKAPQSSAAQTIFTIQNTSRLPQIAGVTLWTDWGYPVLRFNLFLTGYDVQPINLYDIFVRGVIAPRPVPGLGGTSSDTTPGQSPLPGSQAAENDQNPNIVTLAGCANLPGYFTPALRDDLQLLFTTGKPLGIYVTCTKPSGSVHPHAIGYVTIDVKARCSTGSALEPQYWTDDVLYDNVLTGDYLQITPQNGRLTVQGGPLVHLRAVPEGGPAGALPGTTLAHTFYERYSTQKSDRRQPLPQVVAARFIQGGSFNSTMKIWREGFAASSPPCGAYTQNSDVPFLDNVRFDEHENATLGLRCCCITCPTFPSPPAVSELPMDSKFLPSPSTSGDVGGWMYFNFGRQGWVITSMFSQEINGTDFAAVALADGCTAAPLRDAQIGPAP